VTISGTTSGATSSIELSTSGTYFQNSNYTTGVAPTCPGL
jgi:hypothetical protein